jgi:large subunit ribosomal protein L22
LQFDCHKAAKILSKLLLSAIANAEHNYGLNIDNLYVTEIFANNAPIVKRFRARAKGRGNTIFKRRSHISIKVSEIIKKNNIRIK